LGVSPKVFISLCLNVGLGVLYLFITKPGAGRIAEVPGTSLAKASKNQPEVALITLTNLIQTDFKWEQLETSDYKEYIARLRKVGCPEATIRDIILADLDNVYEPKLNKLRGIDPVAPVEPYWLVVRSAPRAKLSLEVEAEIKALQEERTALVKELLGVTEKSIRAELDWYDDAAQSRYSYLTQEQADKLMALEKKYGVWLTGNDFLIEGRTMPNDTKVKMLAEMKEFMTPQEILEYEMRTSDEARMLRTHTRHVELSESEYRNIFGHFYGFLEMERNLTAEDRKNPEKRKERERMEKEVEQSVKDMLGTERFEDIQRFGDHTYRHLVVAAPYLGYDKAAALQAHKMQQDARDAAQAIVKNQALSHEAKARALQDIRRAGEKAISGVIGEKGLKYYQRKGGFSLPELPPAPAQP